MAHQGAVMTILRQLHKCALPMIALAFSFSGSESIAEETPARPPAPSLSRPTTKSQLVDAQGFIRRWLVLEPIPASGRLVESDVQEALQAKPLASLLDIPREGDVVDMHGGLKWHAVETVRYNVNLYHFAWALSKPTSNVVFWAVTTIESPSEMNDVRLAIGSNSASNWWLNGERVIELYDDRQTVIDDGVSKRLTLKKGRNVIVAAIVNGGGATDFCARFLDENDEPITGLAVSLQSL
jgi:hypothetical protein